MAKDGVLAAMQVMGMVSSLRKRVLLLWQAVEFSRSSERPNLVTLQVRPPLTAQRCIPFILRVECFVRVPCDLFVGAVHLQQRSEEAQQSCKQQSSQR